MGPVQQAGIEAERVSREVRETGSLEPVYSALEQAVLAYAAEGGSIEEVVPGGVDDSLGFTRGRPDGRGFWQRYADVLHDELCSPDGELHQQVAQGVATTGASLVTLIVVTLGIPVVAAPVVAPVAGAILGLGVKAICDGGPAAAEDGAEGNADDGADDSG